MEGSPSTLRRFNERRILESLLRSPTASRAELAKSTGLSAPTVGKVADRLLAWGLIEEIEASGPAGGGRPIAGSPASPPGRPSRPLQINRTHPRFIALQIGVRHTRLAPLPVAGPLDERWPAQFKTGRGWASWSKRLQEAANSIGLANPWAVMVSAPGVVDEKACRVIFSPNLHWTESVPLASLIERVWMAPVCLVQEIRALALGHLAAETGQRDFLLVDFGEGVGGAVVTGGLLHQSALPLSGELGHAPIPGNDRVCGCGAMGCLETLVSRRGLIESFSAAHPRLPRSWAGLTRQIAHSGVEPWLGAALDAAAMTIAGAINVVGVREVVITGSLTELVPVVMERLASSLERSAMWARFGRVICRPAPRRRAAGLVAAAIDRVVMPVENQLVRPSMNLIGRTG